MGENESKAFGLVLENLHLDLENCREENKKLRSALERITAIEYKMWGDDWEEIGEAQEIAKAALTEGV